MSVPPIPEGYTSVTPYLLVAGGAAALDFYQKAFGARVLFRMPGPDGTLGHAEMQLGSARIMLADEKPGMGHKGPRTLGGSPVGLMLYVENVDAVVARAAAAGARVVEPVTDKFYGDRMGSLEDPFGHLWYVATHIEDVSPQEMERRMAALHG